jgi:hypothetical protein
MRATCGGGEAFSHAPAIGIGDPLSPLFGGESGNQSKIRTVFERGLRHLLLVMGPNDCFVGKQ